ncbi:MAG: SDR family oxidoreductase [Gemmatimonadales bacterium]
MRTTDQRVLITGGATGIGQALASAFLERGNRVLICGRRADRLEEAAKKMPRVVTEQCDVTDDDGLSRLVEIAVARMDGLSVVVNNAGVQFNDAYGETDIATVLHHVSQEIDTNFSALAKLCALSMPVLSREPEAAIVNISSILAIAPKRSAPVYCATKAAVRSFTKALRYQMEQAFPSVRVFEVLPPLVDTEMTRGRTGKMIPPYHVARALLKGMEQDRAEILVGRTKLLALANRISPRLAEGMMRRR